MEMIQNNSADSELWRKVCDGHVASFERIVEQYQGTVFAVAYSNCGDFQLCQDLTQETFLAAWNSRNQLREPVKLLGWLCSIARKLAAGSYRSKNRFATQSLSNDIDAADDTTGPQEVCISQEEQTIVWDTIQTLPDAYREPLVLFYHEDHSIQAIASAMDISVETAKQRLSRGRSMIRDSLADMVEGILIRSKPGKTLTARIMTSVIGLSTAAATTGTAAAASIGAKAIGQSIGSVAAISKTTTTLGLSGASIGILGGALGSLLGMAGAYLGTKAPAMAAPTMTERRYLEKVGKHSLWISGIFTVLIFALSISMPAAGMLIPYVITTLTILAVFLFLIIRLSLQANQEVKKIRERVNEEDDPNPSKLRKYLKPKESRFVGRRYRSQASLFGIPWVDIQVSDPIPNGPLQPLTATGWVAIGDRANGILLGIGGIARGFIAIGGISLGVISFGGVGVGVLGLGGLGLGIIGIGGIGVGYQAFGGLSAGWDSCGGAAIGWHSAAGGAAIARHAAFGGGAYARDYAVGGGVSAAFANTAEAKAVVAEQSYQWFLEAQLKNPSLAIGAQGVFIVMILVSLVVMMLVMYKKRGSTESL